MLREATTRGFAIDDVAAQALGYRPSGDSEGRARRPTVEVELHVHGKAPISDLAAALSELEGVDAVLATDANTTDE